MEQANKILEDIKGEIKNLTTHVKSMNLKELQEWREKLNNLYRSYNDIVGEEYYTTYKNK